HVSQWIDMEIVEIGVVFNFQLNKLGHISIPVK
ncbi:unnamed protein product, partial [marine sediment metagenome]